MLALLQSFQCVLRDENHSFGMIHLKQVWSLTHEAPVATKYSTLRVGLIFAFSC